MDMIPENTLSQRELRPYFRQTSLREIGITGQEKVKKASFAVVGTGELGCPLFQYLTAGGAGFVLNGKILVFNLLYNSFWLLDIKKAP